MKKFLTKFLTYLVMTMMVTPTWLITGMIGAERAKAAEEPVIDIYTVSPTVISPKNADGVADSASIDLKFSAPVKVDLNILDGNNEVVSHLYQSDSVTNPDPKVWAGNNGESWVKDGTYTVQVLYSYMSADEVPALITKENTAKTIMVDNGTPTVKSLLSKSIVTKAGQSGTIPVVYSEAMNQVVKPTIGFENLKLLESIDLSASTWVDPFTYNINYTVDSGLLSSIEPSKIVVSNAKDLAGNIQDSYETTTTFSVDVVAPKAEIVSPVEFSSVNGTEVIDINADEEFYANNSIILSRDGEYWTEYVDGVTTLNDVPGFKLLPEGSFNLYAEVVDLAGNPATSDSKLSIELVKDTVAPVGTIEYSTTNPTNKPVTAMLVSNEEVVVLNNEGSNKYTFTENGSFTFSFKDAAGNTGTATATVENIVGGELVTSPQITTTVSGKSINITWIAVDNAVSYVVYSNPKSAGVITEVNKGVFANVGNITSYVLNVSEYGEYYVTVTSVDQYGNESSLLSEFTGQKLVAVSAPTPVVTPVPAPAPTAVETQTVVTENNNVSVAAPKANAEEKKEEVAATAKDDEGEIKGDDSAAAEEDKVNWTPWIVLFVLIILAGAATGGYFYWFNGEDEVSAVVREKKEVQKVAPPKETSKKVNNKKSKRW